VIRLHRHDLPEGLSFGSSVAIDTETMGLDPRRDRLCLVQLSDGNGTAHCVQIVPERLGGRGADCPNLKRLLADPEVLKIFHFARFDTTRSAWSWRRWSAPRSPPSWFVPTRTGMG
jgi:ribonuclease D